MQLEQATASERLAWAFGQFGDGLVLSSSFGAQAAVMLHLATQARPDIPVIFVDTGYLFPETYEFADRLAKRLSVNLKVYRSRRSPAWQEALDGKRWEQGYISIGDTHTTRKLEDGMSEEETRFFGLKRECGLHEGTNTDFAI